MKKGLVAGLAAMAKAKAMVALIFAAANKEGATPFFEHLALVGENALTAAEDLPKKEKVVLLVCLLDEIHEELVKFMEN